MWSQVSPEWNDWCFCKHPHFLELDFLDAVFVDRAMEFWHRRESSLRWRPPSIILSTEFILLQWTKVKCLWNLALDLLANMVRGLYIGAIANLWWWVTSPEAHASCLFAILLSYSPRSLHGSLKARLAPFLEGYLWPWEMILVLLLLLLLLIWQKVESPWKKAPQLRNCLHYIGLWACFSGHFLDS